MRVWRSCIATSTVRRSLRHASERRELFGAGPRLREAPIDAWILAADACAPIPTGTEATNLAEQTKPLGRSIGTLCYSKGLGELTPARQVHDVRGGVWERANESAHSTELFVVRASRDGGSRSHATRDACASRPARQTGDEGDPGETSPSGSRDSRHGHRTGTSRLRLRGRVHRPASERHRAKVGPEAAHAVRDRIKRHNS